MAKKRKNNPPAKGRGKGDTDVPHEIVPICPPADVSTCDSCCGLPWAAFSVGNLQLYQDVSYSFCASKTGKLAFINVWWRYDGAGQSGYSAGTGSSAIDFCVNPDDGNGCPDESQILGQGTFIPDIFNFPNSDPNNAFRDGVFANQPSLVAGQRYHLTFKNADADPGANWLSLNAIQIVRHNSDIPGVSDYGDPCNDPCTSVCLKPNSTGVWETLDNNHPFFQVNYVGGGSDGFGYQYANNSIGSLNTPDYQVINGPKRFQQTFIDNCNGREACQFCFYGSRHFGNDPLTVEFITGGNVVETFQVPAPNFPVDPNVTGTEEIDQTHAWICIDLSAGTAVPDRVIWRTETGTQYHIAGLVKARDYTKINSYTSDWAEYTVDGGANWGSFEVFSNSQNAEKVVLSAYFKVKSN